MTFDEAHEYIDSIRPSRCLKSIIQIEINYLEEHINILKDLIEEFDSAGCKRE